MMTEKLYDADAYATEFDATVLSCTPAGEHFAVILDRTLFFPEEGGQKADGGTLGGLPVLDVKIKEDTISHLLPAPLAIGDSVHGSIFWEERFRKMQNHTGEHIVSGIVHRRFGFDNVGFHLGNDEVTLDFSGELTREELESVEDEANRIIYRALPVSCEYPAPEILATLDYRAKKEIAGRVRIVRIAEVDVCACCAPHVRHTGEIGMIKLLEMIRYKGGVRIHMKCGTDALRDYRAKHKEIASSAALFSLKQNELYQGLQTFLQESEKCKTELRATKQALAEAIAASLSPSDGFFFYCHPVREPAFLRDIALACIQQGAPALVLGGNEQEGFAYAIASPHLSLRPISRDWNTAVNGRGGGSESLLQGSCATTPTEARLVFSRLLLTIVS